jgi:hypothetical protein
MLTQTFSHKEISSLSRLSESDKLDKDDRFLFIFFYLVSNIHHLFIKVKKIILFLFSCFLEFLVLVAQF